MDTCSELVLEISSLGIFVVKVNKPIPFVEMTHRYDFEWSLHPNFLLLVFVLIIGTWYFAWRRQDWNPTMYVSEDTFFDHILSEAIYLHPKIHTS